MELDVQVVAYGNNIGLNINENKLNKQLYIRIKFIKLTDSFSINEIKSSI